ncbi:DMT family transporter [Clostridium sp. CM028]|uniref:EamA family transporter n=2 Tax=Clostridium TaxID=1485 RepID=UPI001C6EC970|nr:MULTISPECIES: EamA family transporter [unclassified Clostridium]MBW9149350.1 DMT family transporter [Clostridium sp. CM028]WLC61627.1 DMT family transporter [Clostridium sp. CM028]
MATILMFMWSLSYLSIKVISEEVEPTLSAFYRFMLAAIILFITLKVKFHKEKVLKEEKFKFALGGLFGVTLYFIFENRRLDDSWSSIFLDDLQHCL